jgi:hypothetical protein
LEDYGQHSDLRIELALAGVRKSMWTHLGKRE